MGTYYDQDTRAAAIELLAARNLTVTEIAEKLGVSRRTLYYWRDDPDFAAELDAKMEEFRKEVARIGIADVMKRVNALNDRWNRMRQIIEARADHESYADAPGGSTGLLLRSLRQLGSGEHATIVEEFEVDTGLLAELRNHEKQAAQELGQWAEKSQLTGSDGGPIQFEASIARMKQIYASRREESD